MRGKHALEDLEDQPGNGWKVMEDRRKDQRPATECVWKRSIARWRTSRVPWSPG